MSVSTPGPTPPATPTQSGPAPVPRLLAGRRRWVFAALVAVGAGRAATAVGWTLLVARLARGEWMSGAGSPLPAQELMAAGALALVSGGLLYAERVLAERLGQSWVTSVRVTLFDRVTSAPVRGVGQGRSTGGTSLRMMGNLSALRRWASLGLAKLAVALPLVGGCLVALALVAPLVAVAALVVTTVGLGAIMGLSPWLRSAHRVARRRQARVAAHVVERVGKTPVVQAFGRERGERRRVARRSRKLANAHVRRARAVGTVRAIGESTTLVTTATVLVVAAASGAGAGSAAAAIAVVGIMVTPLRELTRVNEYRAGRTVALRQIGAELARPRRSQPAADAPPLPDGGGAVALRSVRVDGVVHWADADVPAGSRVALTGPNGSGKTTLLSVIAGLVSPDEGRVVLDGADIARCRTDSVRSAIGVAGPHLPLLRGTIADNVRYANPRTDGWRLHEAIRASGLDELVADLPEGLRTPVREDGGGLSAGQQQRVAIARALLTRPRLLLLDEADAHLDAGAVDVVDRAISAFSGTVVVVTHRAERLATADLVWRLSSRILREEPPAGEHHSDAFPPAPSSVAHR